MGKDREVWKRAGGQERELRGHQVTYKEEELERRVQTVQKIWSQTLGEDKGPSREASATGGEEGRGVPAWIQSPVAASVWQAE